MPSTLARFVEEDFGYKSSGGVWGRSIQHSSLVVNEVKDIFFWNSKGLRGDSISYLMNVRGLSKNQAKELYASIAPSCGVYIPSVSTEETPYEKLVDLLWTNGKNTREYWYNRLISDEFIDRFRLGYFEDWYIIPLYNEQNVFVNFQCRRETPEKRIKYWYKYPSFRPAMLNREVLTFVDTVYITEGLVDCIKLIQEGLPSISQSGGAGYWNNEWYHLFSNVKTIYYLADNDSAGIHGAIKVAKSLGTSRVKVYSFEGEKDSYDSIDFFREGKTVDELVENTKTKSKYIFELEEYSDKNWNRP